MITISQGQVTLSPDGKRRLEIALHLKEGDVALLAGPNGSGKTTLLDVIAGVRVLDSGSLEISNNPPSIAYAVQDSTSGLLPWKTVVENILLPSTLHNVVDDEITARSEALLEKFRLNGRVDDYPYKLSGGEKQAVNFIRTLCTPCSIALFDEVLASLHNDLRALAKAELVTWLQRKTAILISHDLDDLDLPFTRFFEIKAGTIHEVDQKAMEKALRHGD